MTGDKSLKGHERTIGVRRNRSMNTTNRQIYVFKSRRKRDGSDHGLALRVVHQVHHWQ